MAIPTQANTNMEDPREFALWALAGLLKDSRGDVMIVSEESLRDASAILARAGFRHHLELQTIKRATPPGADSVHWLGAGAFPWVPMETPEPEVVQSVAPKPDLDAMSGEQLIELVADLQARGVIRAPEESIVEGDLAQVRTIEVD